MNDISPASARTLHPGNRCQRCDYDLGGLTTNLKCPECGLEIRRSLPEFRPGTRWQLEENIKSWWITAKQVERAPREAFAQMRWSVPPPMSGGAQSFMLSLLVLVQPLMVALLLWPADLALVANGATTDSITGIFSDIACCGVLLPIPLWAGMAIAALIRAPFRLLKSVRLNPLLRQNARAHAMAHALRLMIKFTAIHAAAVVLFTIVGVVASVTVALHGKADLLQDLHALVFVLLAISVVLTFIAAFVCLLGGAAMESIGLRIARGVDDQAPATE